MDVLFVEYYDRSEKMAEVLTKHIRPKNIVFMNLPTDRNKKEVIAKEISKSFPRAVVFMKSMETRKFR